MDASRVAAFRKQSASVTHRIREVSLSFANERLASSYGRGESLPQSAEVGRPQFAGFGDVRTIETDLLSSPLRQ